MSFNELASVRADLVRLRSELDKVLRIVVDGNGSSLMSRTAVMETKIDTIEEVLTRMSDYSNTVRIALLTSAVSLLGSVIVLVIELIVKK